MYLYYLIKHALMKDCCSTTHTHTHTHTYIIFTIQLVFVTIMFWLIHFTKLFSVKRLK